MDMWAKIQKTFTGLMCGLRGKRNDWNIYWNRRNNDNQGMRRIQTSTCPWPKNFLYCFHFFAVFQLRFGYLAKIYCWFITKHSKNPWNCCYSAAGTKNGLLHIPVVLGLRGGSLQLMTHCFVLLLEECVLQIQKAVVKVLIVDQKQMIIKILDTVSMKLGFSLAGIRKWFMSTFLLILRILMNSRPTPDRGLYNEWPTLF